MSTQFIYLNTYLTRKNKESILRYFEGLYTNFKIPSFSVGFSNNDLCLLA